MVSCEMGRLLLEKKSFLVLFVGENLVKLWNGIILVAQDPIYLF